MAVISKDSFKTRQTLDVGGRRYTIYSLARLEAAGFKVERLPYSLKRCAELLASSTVKASTTIGFPHGGHTTSIKVAEALQALSDGGQELDMVVNISQVLSGQWDYVRREIQDITDAAHPAVVTRR